MATKPDKIRIQSGALRPVAEGNEPNYDTVKKGALGALNIANRGTKQIASWLNPASPNNLATQAFGPRHLATDLKSVFGVKDPDWRTAKSLNDERLQGIATQKALDAIPESKGFTASQIMPGVTEYSTPLTRSKGTRAFTNLLEAGASPNQVAGFEENVRPGLSYSSGGPQSAPVAQTPALAGHSVDTWLDAYRQGSLNKHAAIGSKVDRIMPLYAEKVAAGIPKQEALEQARIEALATSSAGGLKEAQVMNALKTQREGAALERRKLDSEQAFRQKEGRRADRRLALDEQKAGPEAEYKKALAQAANIDAQIKSGQFRNDPTGEKAQRLSAYAKIIEAINKGTFTTQEEKDAALYAAERFLAGEELVIDKPGEPEVERTFWPDREAIAPTYAWKPKQ